MVESVIPAVVERIRDLRRPGEKIGIFYSDDGDGQIKGEVVGYEIQINSMIFPGVYLKDVAHPVFAINKDLKNNVVIAKWEKNKKRVESKLFVVGIEQYIARKWNLVEIDNSSILRLYMEHSIAERLGINDMQRVTLLPTPIWRADKKISDSD